MAEKEHYFVEWKEQYVSKERGNRVVHYFLKDNLGESILAVVGTERSVRHMFYVVSEEFSNAHGADSSAHAGFRWRSRREVVHWLTSMLAKQHRQADRAMSPKDDPTFKIKAQQSQMPAHKARLARNLKGRHLDIVWSGSAWTCSKHLKHYPAFCRNGISISVQSFVFVMAEKENRHIAYLEDMYEDKKGQKKVKVRWFHHNREVRGVVSLRSFHPKELFITPYVQVISAECVDGPAIVLTQDHYEKCIAVLPHDLLERMYFCFRQFKSNRVKPFKLSKLRGYIEQQIFSSFSPDFFEDEEFSSEDNVKGGTKRGSSGRESLKISSKKLKADRKSNFLKQHVGSHLSHDLTFNVNDKIEFLCQDSGIRGCWFRCTIIVLSRRQMKIQYDDVKDEESCTNLEEWITYRVAKIDKLGMRNPGRPNVRPAYTHDNTELTFELGSPVDAWWSDGWWEGIISGTKDLANGSYQIYIPGENMYLNIEGKNLRASREWIGDRWLDIDPIPNILSVISATSLDTKLSTSSAIAKEAKSDNSPTSCHIALTSTKLTAVEEEINELACMTPTKSVPAEDCIHNEQQQDCTNNEQQQILPDEDGEDNTVVEPDEDDHAENNDNNDDPVEDGRGNEDRPADLEVAEQRCEPEPMEVTTGC